MKVCWRCKIALYNGCYCPKCRGHLADYNRDYVLNIVYNDPSWELATHEADLRGMYEADLPA